MIYMFGYRLDSFLFSILFQKYRCPQNMENSMHDKLYSQHKMTMNVSVSKNPREGDMKKNRSRKKLSHNFSTLHLLSETCNNSSQS